MIFKHKTQSICNHVLHQAHTLIFLGMLLHAYVCLSSFGFLVFFFVFSRNASMKAMVIKKQHRRLIIRKHQQKRYSLKSFNEIIYIIRF